MAKKPHVNVNDHLADALEAATGVRPTREYRFTQARRWRVDLCYVDQKIAIEVDGRSHCSLSGHRKDCEKANALIECGFVVMRYPASAVLTHKRLPRIVEQITRKLAGVRCDDSFAIVLTGG